MDAAYIANFGCQEDVLRSFNAPSDALDDATVHIAWYGYGDYSGSAFVLYEKNGKLYEVNGSHCSCNGLEDQWEPEETTWEALAHIVRNGTKFYGDYDESSAAQNKLSELVDARVPVEAK